MPNWCSTAYVIDGDAKEVKQLYELMKGLEAVSYTHLFCALLYSLLP